MGLPKPLTILLVIYLLLASAYSVITPVFEASDELWHYPMVKYIADQRGIPVQTAGIATAWRQEGSQPPLYYIMAALLTVWIDTSDLDAVRRINPHADIGVLVPDGNVNMTIHDPAARAFPWRGTTLAVHIARFFSVLLSAVTVMMTYHLTEELFPPPHAPSQTGSVNWLALAAATFVAFNPMFLFISGSVNNDNLSNAVASVLLVLIVRLLKRPKEAGVPTVRELIGIGILAGAGMLAKFNIGFLLPIIALALAVVAWRLRDVRFFVRGALITGGLTVAIAGWWYVRNWQLYGDPTGLNMFIKIVGPRAAPANWPQLWSERHTFLMSYWGFFGGINVPLPEPMYTVFNGIAALSLIGLVMAGVGLFRRRENYNWPIIAGRAVTILWIAVLFGGLIRWTSETWASQGRLMFSAIAPISMWMAVGLWALGRAVPLVRWRLARLAVWWFAMAAILSLSVISHSYSDPYPEPVAFNNYISALGGFEEPGSQYPYLTLYEANKFYAYPRYFVEKFSEYRVGEYVTFCAKFGQTEPFSRDWSAFIHLETPSGVIVAQRDVYPGQGLWATSLIREREWCNNFAIRIPEYAYAPQILDVYLGFYDHKTGERMPFWGSENKPLPRVNLGSLKLLPRESALPVPNPMSANLGDEADLIGYAVSPNSLVYHPGDQVTVTLYWRAHKTGPTNPIRDDYRVFVQILEPNTSNVFASSDAMPAGWNRPTTTWKSGEIIEDKHTLTINPNAPPGTWQIVVGMYRFNENELEPTRRFERLRVITPDGGQADNFVGLTRVKIAPQEIF